MRSAKNRPCSDRMSVANRASAQAWFAGSLSSAFGRMTTFSNLLSGPPAPGLRVITSIESTGTRGSGVVRSVKRSRLSLVMAVPPQASFSGGCIGSARRAPLGRAKLGLGAATPIAACGVRLARKRALDGLEMPADVSDDDATRDDPHARSLAVGLDALALEVGVAERGDERDRPVQL